MKIFSMDSPLMVALTKMADLLWLNVLAIICCIPVITVGASMTALHYMALKLARNEETYITKGFFKSFKENFRQGTVIWLIQLVVFIILLVDYYLLFFTEADYGTVMQILLFAITVVFLIVSVFVYPVLAKFDNSIAKTLKNSLVIGLLQLPKTVLILAMFVAVPVLMLTEAGMKIFPILFLFGFSAPAFAGAKLYSRFFEKLEEKVIAANPEAAAEPENEDEHIFSDELDPSIAANDNIE